MCAFFSNFVQGIATFNARRFASTEPNTRAVVLQSQKAQRWKQSSPRRWSSSHQTARSSEAVKLNASVEGTEHSSASQKKELTPLELMDLAKQLGKESKRVSVQDKDGETHVLAYIPDDVRKYTWKSSEWTWGVTERLFQESEQAKIKFEKEEYVDELDGKKKKRVKSDESGQHVGVAEGWWFDGNDASQYARR
jgi:hypothetical protein